MAKEKQHVFSARTTEQGLKELNELKARLGVSWDEMVIDAMCARYGLDKTVMALPKKDMPAKETQKETSKETEEPQKNQPGKGNGGKHGPKPKRKTSKASEHPASGPKAEGGGSAA